MKQSKVYDYGPIGQRIKSARKQKGCTQEFLAEKLNVSPQHISEIERGLNGLSIPSLMEICKTLNTDADYILFGKPTASQNNPIYNLIQKMTPQQSMYAEEILISYAKACNIVK